jgi:hypothetical protein
LGRENPTDPPEHLQNSLLQTVRAGSYAAATLELKRNNRVIMDDARSFAFVIISMTLWRLLGGSPDLESLCSAAVEPRADGN